MNTHTHTHTHEKQEEFTRRSLEVVLTSVLCCGEACTTVASHTRDSRRAIINSHNQKQLFFLPPPPHTQGVSSHGSNSATRNSTVLTCTEHHQSRMGRRVELLHAQPGSQSVKPKHWLPYLNQRGKVLLSFSNTCLW